MAYQETKIQELQSNIIYISGASPVDGYFSNIIGSNSNINISNQTSSTGVSSRFYLDTYNNTNIYGSSYRGRRLRGTPDYPSGVLKDDVLLQLVGDGYSESGNMENAAASFAIIASEDFRSGKHGTYARIRTTPTGTATQLERILITSEGKIGLNHSNPLYVLDISGNINCTNGVYVNGVLLQGGSGSSTNVSGEISGNIGKLDSYGMGFKKTQKNIPNNTNILMDITGLNFYANPNNTYGFETYIPFMSNTAACGLTLYVSGPTGIGATGMWSSEIMTTPVAGTDAYQSVGRMATPTVSGIHTTASVAMINHPLFARLMGHWVCDNNSGVVQIRFAPEVNGNMVTILRGAWLKYF